MIAIWPAIDLMDGRVVRLLHGDPQKKTLYAGDPADVARLFASDGADGLHVVDLDAAFGKGSNGPAVAAILSAVKVPVEVGGGLRSLDGVERLLGAGAARVVLGSLPFTDPSLFARILEAHPERVVVALDCKEGRPTVKGWTEVAGEATAASAARRLGAEGVAALLVTDVARDGAMTGPNLELLAEVRGVFGGEVLASGGMRGAGDLAPAAAALFGGPAGAIFGRSLHDGAVTVRALAAARQSLREGVR